METTKALVFERSWIGLSMLAVLCLAGVLFLGTHAFANSIDEPANLGEAADPPAGAHMSMVATGDGSVLVTVSGMEVYHDWLFLYGDPDGVKQVKLVNGSVKIPPRYWVNLPFKGSDGLWHYLHVADENQVIPKLWMGENVCVMPDFGKGSAITYCGWVRKQH